MQTSSAQLENIDKVNIDELYNRIIMLIENVAIKVNNEMTFLIGI